MPSRARQQKLQINPRLLPQQATSEVAKPLDKLDEIVVNGKRVTIADLRRTAEKAEDAFYERYNEVNKDDAFDVDCQVDREGLFRQHRCTALYVERAQASDGIMLVGSRKEWLRATSLISPRTEDADTSR